MTRYSPEFKVQMVRKMMPPNNHSVSSIHHIIDWNYDEDRGRIRSGHGPADVTRLRRFAIGLRITFQHPGQSMAQMMRQLARRPRQVLDYLRLTNSAGGRA